MFKVSLKCLDFAFKPKCISFNGSLERQKSIFQNIKCISVINITKYSTEASSQSKSEEIIRIYNAPLTNRLRFTKMFSFTTSLASFMLLPKVTSKLQECPEKAGFYLSILTLVSMFTFGTPLGLHLMSRKYILFIDYNLTKNSYTLYTYSFFLKLVPLNFYIEDVAVITHPFATVSIRGSKFLMEPSNFNDLDHYKRMIGFDKELNFKLEDQNESASLEPRLRRPEIPDLKNIEAVCAKPKVEHPEKSSSSCHIPKTIETEKISSYEDRTLPINLRKKKKK